MNLDGKTKSAKERREREIDLNDVTPIFRPDRDVPRNWKHLRDPPSQSADIV